MMRFGRPGNTRPEQIPRRFFVYAQSGTKTLSNGRLQPGSVEPVREFRGVLSGISQSRKLTFSRVGVTVTHAVIQPGLPIAKRNDQIEMLISGMKSRFFRVEAVMNKGELNMQTVYLCLERDDVL